MATFFDRYRKILPCFKRKQEKFPEIFCEFVESEFIKIGSDQDENLFNKPNFKFLTFRSIMKHSYQHDSFVRNLEIQG